MPRPMIAVARPKEKAMKRYSNPTAPIVASSALRVPDRADLGEVAAEGQAGGPVDHRARLAGRARDLAHVVGPRHPPGGEAAEGAAADPAHRLVAAEVDEGGVAAVARTGAALPMPSSAAMLRAATGPWRTACWAVGGQRPPRGSGAAAQSPIAQTESMPLTRRWSSTGTRPRSSSGTRELAQARVRRDAGGPDDGPGRQRLAGREPGAVGASPPPGSCRGGCRCRGRAARAARSRRARRRSRAGPGRLASTRTQRIPCRRARG